MPLILLLLSSFLAYIVNFRQTAGSLKYLIWMLLGYFGSQFFLGKLLSVSPLVSLVLLFFALPWAVSKWVLQESNRTSTSLGFLTLGGALLIPFVLGAIGLAIIFGIVAVI